MAIIYHRQLFYTHLLQTDNDGEYCFSSNLSRYSVWLESSLLAKNSAADVAIFNQFFQMTLNLFKVIFLHPFVVNSFTILPP